MKNYFEKFVLLVVVGAFMTGVNLYAENLIYYQDSAATTTLRMIPVSNLTPLPIVGVVSIGSATIEAGQPPTDNLMDIVSVTATASDVASLANRKSINVFNFSATETVWISLDSAVASATVGASIPIFPYGYVGVELDSSKVLSIVSATAVSAAVYQDGY